MDKIKRWPIVLLSLVLLALCGFSASRFVLPYLTSTPQTPPPPAWFTDWLTAPACQPPCWQGITPGVTTITETYEILQDLPGVIVEEGPSRPVVATADLQLDWTFASGTDAGGMATAFDSGLINHFVLADTQLAPVEKVIERYGAPSHMFAHSCNIGKCETVLLYLETGMAIILYLDWNIDWNKDARDEVTVMPESEVKRIEFFMPGIQGYLNAHPAFSEGFQESISPWVGYGKYHRR